MKTSLIRRHLPVVALVVVTVCLLGGCSSSDNRAAAPENWLYTVVSMIDANPASVVQTQAALETLAIATRQEIGNQSFQLYRCIDGAAGPANYDFLTYENWSAESFANTHTRTHHYRTFQNQANTLLAAPMVVARCAMLSSPTLVTVDPAHIPVVSRMWARPGQQQNAETTLANFVAFARSEAGCAGYDLHRGIDEPNQFILHEAWRDEAAVNFHLGTQQFADFMGQSPTLFTDNGYIEVNFLNLISQ
jgi:quinol monooxygenase YgiN